MMTYAYTSTIDLIKDYIKFKELRDKRLIELELRRRNLSIKDCKKLYPELFL